MSNEFNWSVREQLNFRVILKVLNQLIHKHVEQYEIKDMPKPDFVVC